jgi:hypothetical protein
MKGQTLLTGYLSISPSPSPSPSSSAPSTPRNLVIEITDESEDGEEDELPPLIPVSSSNEIPPLVRIRASAEPLGRTRQRTVNMIARAAARSDGSDVDSETDSEVDVLIRGDEEGPPKMQEHTGWSILRDQIDKLLKKQKKKVTMRLSEVC